MAAGGLVIGGCLVAGLASGRPLARWAALGRSRRAPTAAALRFPRPELAAATTFALVAVRLGASWSLLPELALVAGLLPLAFLDATRLRLPTPLVYRTLAAVGLGALVAAGAGGDWGRLPLAAGCALAWSGLYFAVNRANPRWLGYGDVRLALVLGLGLGWLGVGPALAGFFLGHLVAILAEVGLVAAGRRRWGAPLPLGAYLAAGAFVALLV